MQLLDKFPFVTLNFILVKFHVPHVSDLVDCNLELVGLIKHEVQWLKKLSQCLAVSKR